MSILSDEDTFGNISAKCRKAYQAVWYDFKDFNQSSSQFDSRFPNEIEMLEYFKKLGEVNKFVFTTLWTKYSIINSVVKAKYGRKLQEYPRLTANLKTFNGVDEKKKSDIFSLEELDAFIGSHNDTKYSKSCHCKKCYWHPCYVMQTYRIALCC